MSTSFPTPEQIAQMKEKTKEEKAALEAETDILCERLKKLEFPDSLIPRYVCEYGIPNSFRAWVEYCEKTPDENRLWYNSYFSDIWAKQ
jgi:hypothetical protein